MIFTHEQKVGFFIMVALSILAFSIVMLGDISFQKKYHLFVLFSDIEGLPDKAAVKISGVEVGKIVEITLDNNNARVKIWIRSDLKIHEDAEASVVSTGIIGTKFLQISIGSKDKPVLRNGDVIIGKDAFSYEAVFSKAMDGIDELKNVLSEVRGEGVFGRNLNEAMKSFKNVAVRFDEITFQHKEDIKIALSNLREISDGLKATINVVKKISEKIDKGEGVIAKLVNDEEMGEDLKHTVKEAKQVLNRITLFRTYWDYRLRYDFEDEQYRNDLSLKIYPVEGKYYHIGASNVGDTKDNPDDPEEKNTITAEIGKSFGPVTVHAGVIRSKGGLGLAYRPWEKLEFNAEVYDFSREMPSKTPVYTAGSRILVTDWAYVGGQVEDIAERKNFNAYLNIVFEDKDIAYLLGLVGLAR